MLAASAITCLHTGGSGTHLNVDKCLMLCLFVCLSVCLFLKGLLLFQKQRCDGTLCSIHPETGRQTQPKQMFRFAERQIVERTLPSLRHRLYSSTGGDPPGSEFVDCKRRIVAAPGHTHLSLRMHILSVDYRLILSAETGFSLTNPQCGRRWTPCL